MNFDCQVKMGEMSGPVVIFCGTPGETHDVITADRAEKAALILNCLRSCRHGVQVITWADEDRVEAFRDFLEKFLYSNEELRCRAEYLDGATIINLFVHRLSSPAT